MVGSNVKRLGTSRPKSTSHTSTFPCTTRVTATQCPSGASAGFPSAFSSGWPTVPNTLPVRSTHTSCRATVPPEAGTRSSGSAVPASGCDSENIDSAKSGRDEAMRIANLMLEQSLTPMSATAATLRTRGRRRELARGGCGQRRPHRDERNPAAAQLRSRNRQVARISEPHACRALVASRH